MKRYLTVFNYSFDKVGVEGLTSMTTKLRSAGLPDRDACPARALMPPGLTPLEVAQRGRALAQAGVIGVREGPTRRDPETLALLFDTIRLQVNPDHGLARATTFQWEFTDPDVPTWHLTVNNGSSAVEQGDALATGRAPAPVLPGLGRHRRPAAGPDAGDRDRQAAPARQPVRARAAGQGLSPRLRAPARAGSSLAEAPRWPG